MVGIRLSDAARNAVERWARDEPDTPTLSEAIRRLIELGLKAGGTALRKGKQ
jgi:hypothetical protein